MSDSCPDCGVTVINKPASGFIATCGQRVITPRRNGCPTHGVMTEDMFDMKRITDLEKFALEQIWRPYQNMEPHKFESRLEALPCSLDDTARMLSEKSDWSECVLSRISAISFTFPTYIVHPLVNLIKTEQKIRRVALARKDHP